MVEPSIYLDYAAATPLDSQVLAAMQPYLTTNFYNPSAQYQAARSAQRDLLAARTQVAHWLGARPSEIIFTAGGTEANNLAIHGIMRRYSSANLVVSGIEHSAILAPARHYDWRTAAVANNGLLDLAALQASIDQHTVLVSIMYANNEIGTVQPIRRVSQLLADIRRERRASGNQLPLYFHTDACQATNYLDMHAARLGVDLMTLNGSKIYGPKQSGGLFVRGGLVLEPLIDGGGQERGLRAGTENLAAAVGLATAVELAQQLRHSEARRLQILQRQCITEIQQALPTAIINGSTKQRLPNNVHVTLPGQDNERLLIGLDEAGIMAAAGSACSASSQEPSTVLQAIGLSAAAARSSLRFSFGRATTAAELERVVKVLQRLVS